MMRFLDMTVLYIHGFNSSPASTKAQQTRTWLKEISPNDEYICPALSGDTQLAISQLEKIIEQCSDTIGLIGSSLGGFYATWLAQKYDLRAVLINPAVEPHKTMNQYLGENTNYHSGETYMLTQYHIDFLESINVDKMKSPKDTWVLLQTKDEVLDYRQAESKYQKCNLTIEQGGNHSFQDYEQHLPAIIKFLQP
ncbi:MAG: esterase YqiA [Porticoccus sp.]|jgi:predicted esterase YcpF (UPF0227 family)|nr:esterase YqiA [Porticoccus sp.]